MAWLSPSVLRWFHSVFPSRTGPHHKAVGILEAELLKSDVYIQSANEQPRQEQAFL